MRPAPTFPQADRLPGTEHNNAIRRQLRDVPLRSRVSTSPTFHCRATSSAVVVRLRASTSSTADRRQAERVSQGSARSPAQSTMASTPRGEINVGHCIGRRAPLPLVGEHRLAGKRLAS